MIDPASPRLSVEAFEQVLRQRGHDRHIELIRGEIVEKMPNEAQGYWVLELGFFLRDYLKRAGFGRVVTRDRVRLYQADDVLESPDVLPEFRLSLPDLFTYPREP